MVVGSLAERAARRSAPTRCSRACRRTTTTSASFEARYYAENESAASRSRHKELTPSMSALVVKSHITDGLELARKERLPRAVRNAIPEHHGTMVMAFFYDKALELDPTVRREDLLLSRSQAALAGDGDPDARRRRRRRLARARGADAEPHRGLVTRIVEQRVQDGQLDECGLTLSEVAKIREAFIPVLTAIFHVRVPYPEEVRRRSRADADLRKDAT
jgi:hypothetical protein